MLSKLVFKDGVYISSPRCSFRAYLTAHTHQTPPAIVLPHRDPRNITMAAPCFSFWKLLLCSVLISPETLTSASFIPAAAADDHMLIDTILEPKNGTVWTPKSTAKIAWKTCAPSLP